MIFSCNTALLYSSNHNFKFYINLFHVYILPKTISSRRAWAASLFLSCVSRLSLVPGTQQVHNEKSLNKSIKPGMAGYSDVDGES